MEFLDEVSEKEFEVIRRLDSSIPTIPEHCKCYWVKVSKDDFLHNIHLIQQGVQDFATWDVFDIHLCLGYYAKRVKCNDYLIGKHLKDKFPLLQSANFDVIKTRTNEFSRTKMIETPLCYWANSKEGPYIIRESIRRHIAAYIHYFILKKEDFSPIEKNAICMITDDGYSFPQIPYDLCDSYIK